MKLSKKEQIRIIKSAIRDVNSVRLEKENKKLEQSVLKLITIVTDIESRLK